jgi:hypothetical protein
MQYSDLKGVRAKKKKKKKKKNKNNKAKLRPALYVRTNVRG